MGSVCGPRIRSTHRPRRHVRRLANGVFANDLNAPASHAVLFMIAFTCTWLQACVDDELKFKK
jgi:hypothetical protein